MCNIISMQKYKVFFNEKCIRFTRSSNITLNKPLAESTVNAVVSNVGEWLKSFGESVESETVLEHENPELLFNKFKSAFLIIEAAGGVVIRNEKLLFIFRNGKWDLPKGKIDEGENAPVAAIREVEEECGIDGHKIVKSLPSTFHIYVSPYKKTKGQWVLKKTFWYEMNFSGQEEGIPQQEEGITEVRWFEKAELDEVYANTYENLKQIIDLYR